MILETDEQPDHMIGIDPGESTGLFGLMLAPVEAAPGAWRNMQTRIEHGEHFGGEVSVASIREFGRAWYVAEARLQRNVVGRLRDVAVRHGIDLLHLAIEDFTLRERTKDRSLLSPVRMTSGILALIEDDDELNVCVHLNSASDGKGTVTDVVLRRLGLYCAGQQHANDAARQAVLALRKEA